MVQGCGFRVGDAAGLGFRVACMEGRGLGEQLLSLSRIAPIRSFLGGLQALLAAYLRSHPTDPPSKAPGPKP